jgi:5-methyltetrahydropteroyltriglutamate--homocysteine methyltransferase
MKMPLSAQLGGIHPRSEQLIDLTRSYERGKTERANLEQQFEQDTRELVSLEEEAGFESFSDGALEWQDQLRPIVESLAGITTGTRYSRWFDTNTFYRKPAVTGRVGLAQFDLKKFIRTDLLPRSKTWKVSLVGPYTFSELAENLHYKSRPDLLSDLAHAEHEIIQRLTAARVSQFQISEPCLVYRPYRQETLSSNELASALAALRKTVEGSSASITVQTYFGDATRILPDLLKLPIAGVGFDLFETHWSRFKIETEKKLALGIVDSRESNVEEPKWISETATRVSKHVLSDKIILVPNSDLKFVPRKVADAKARSLADATRLMGEEN